MTLAQFMQEVSAPASDTPSVDILINGARAEATLPIIWWGELMLTRPDITTWNIHFIGPEVPVRSATATSEPVEYKFPDLSQTLQVHTHNWTFDRLHASGTHSAHSAHTAPRAGTRFT